MTKVAAFDISTSTGGTVDGPNGRPVSATFHGRMDGDNLGPLFVAFERWMIDFVAVHQPDVGAIEAPWVPSGNRNSDRPTAVIIPRMLIGMAAVAELVICRAGIECCEASVNTVRKFFVGDGRAGKAPVQARCRQLGWAIRNDHEADSCALWSYTKAILDPHWAPNSTPLFARTA